MMSLILFAIGYALAGVLLARFANRCCFSAIPLRMLVWGASGWPYYLALVLWIAISDARAAR